MTYNNFICRLSVPRLSAAASAPAAPKVAPKKARKPARQRLAVAAAAMCVLLGCSAGSLQAATDDEPAGTLRLIPATGTVPFTGLSSRAFFDEETRPVFDEPTLAARMDEFTAQVNALTTQAWQQVTPPSPARLSGLTGALLAAGVGVALFRARLLLRPDLVC